MVRSRNKDLMEEADSGKDGDVSDDDLLNEEEDGP